MHWFILAACVSAASSSSLVPSSTSAPQSTTTDSALATENFITIPLAVPSGDGYYNAILTDSAGSEIGVRVDLLQPDVWLMNALDIIDCSVLLEYYSEYSTSSNALSITYSGEVWDASLCYLDGAFTPVVVTTTVDGSQTKTTTLAANLAASTSLTISYPNGIYADGVLYSANLTLGTTSNERLGLDNFRFVLASDTNVYAGGLGLASNPRGLGILDALKHEGHILSSGYSLFFSGYDDLNTSAGELLLGAVDQKYYEDTLYEFASIPYEGWTNGNSSLPIVGLEEVTLVNSETSQLVSLSNKLKLPVLLDTRLNYSFLPLDIIVNLAIQTNAYYNSEYDRWIVKCSDIESSNATVNFKFGPLEVPVPLSTFVYDAYYGEDYLYFSTGVRACFLNVMRDTTLGYSSLGLQFLTLIYLAMDNESGKLAMAKANTSLVVNLQDFLFSETPSAYPSSFSASQRESATNATASATIAYIQSGTIPFAASATYSSNYTMTFFSANSSNAETIPSRLTVATIRSGEVYITNSDGVTFSRINASASAANAHTLKSEGYSVKSYVSRNMSFIPYVILLAGGVIAVMLA